MQKCTEDRFLTFDFLEKESRGFGKAARHARESRKHTAGTLSVAWEVWVKIGIKTMQSEMVQVDTIFVNFTDDFEEDIY